jgi:hypothetical protein
MRLLPAFEALATAVMLVASSDVGAQVSPYAGQQTREIKALSAQEVDDLLNARGMALAKAAELNGYPGPLHSIELVVQLGLTSDQLRTIRETKARVEAAAIPLGTKIVSYERELDQLFASGTVTQPQLESLMAALGELQGQLRGIHLAAHLETRALLNDHQIARYNELRGYMSSDSPPVHDPVKRHGG